MAPAGIACVAPSVVVQHGAAHVDRPVDRAGAADYPSARPAFGPAL